MLSHCRQDSNPLKVSILFLNGAQILSYFDHVRSFGNSVGSEIKVIRKIHSCKSHYLICEIEKN